MPSRRSAGLLLYRRHPGALEVLIGHMGGPFWSKRDERGWSVPKGEYDAEHEEPLAAARREFEEELGVPAPDGQLLALGEVRQPSGKIITVWAVEGDLDPAAVVPGVFSMEWPSRSGRFQEFPELDRVAWVGVDVARTKLVAGQVPFVDHLVELLVPTTAEDGQDDP